MKVAITKPTPREIAIGAKYAASPLVSNIKVSSPPNVVSVVKITALNLFLADIYTARPYRLFLTPLLIKFINKRLSLITTPINATAPISPVIETGSPLKSTPNVIPIIQNGTIDIISNGCMYDFNIVAKIK